MSGGSMRMMFFLCVAGGLTALAEEGPTDYPVRAIDPGSERFEKIFAEVVRIRVTRTHRPRAFKVLQKVAEGGYLVREALRVKRAVGGGGVVALGNPDATAERIEDGALFWMPPGAEELADGERTGGYFTTTEATFSYTTVAGAASTVRRLRRDPEFSKEAFLADLKGGATYPFEVKKAVRCQVCRGFGKPDSPCKVCKGTGEVVEVTRFLIRW